MGKGLISIGLGLLAVYVGTGEDFYPRMSLGSEGLSRGFPITTAVLGVLIIGAVFKELDEIWRSTRGGKPVQTPADTGNQKLTWGDVKRLLPTIARSAAIGTSIGALPGVGSTLAATLGYTVGRARHKNHQTHPTCLLYTSDAADE